MIEIIPAMDIIDGKCVRLEQGDFSRKTEYGADPVSVAQSFEDAGLTRLHMVDLDGARDSRPANLRVLEAVSSRTELTIDYGGGLATREDVESAFSAGAAAVSIGSAAVRSPESFLKWVERFGAERFLLGADVRGGKIAIDGWATSTELPVVDLLRDYLNKGVRRAFVTDVAKDGLLAGPSTHLYEGILSALPNLELIASGGVSDIRDIGKLENIGCRGVIVGKAIYEGRISLDALARGQWRVSEHAG